MAWGLAFHIVAMAVLFGLVGLPEGVVRAIAAWKEALALFLVGAVALRTATGQGGHATVRPADLLVVGLFALTGLHLLAAVGGWGPVDEAAGLAYGARDLVFFMALYFVGRATPHVAASTTALRQLWLIGLLTSAIAVVEWIFVTPEMLVALGVASYISDFLGASLFTAANEYGLPDSYWTMIGGRLVQRAGSVHLSSQGFAIPFLVIMPVATVWMYLRDRWRSPSAIAGYALLWFALLLTITRMTILACTLQVLLIILLRKRPAPLVALGVAGTAALAVLLAVVPGLAGYVWETLLWQTASSDSHSRDYAKGLAAFVQHPLGSGLGTTDATAARLGLTPLTADNLFLKYLVELGVAGGLLFIAYLAYCLWTGVRCALTALDERRRTFGALGAALALGVAVNGTTAGIFNLPMLAYLYFWLAGAMVTICNEGESRG
ncbi:MAG TPA: O-antigen ligase family protein [Gemmatimonadales bacterium]